MRIIPLLLALFVALAAHAQSPQPDPQYQRASPFEAVKWVDGVPEVLVAGTWARVVSIDDVPVSDILAFCGKRWGEELVVKRFEEDLVEAMARMGYAPKESVRLVLRDSSEKERTVNAAMTEENRQRLRRAGVNRAIVQRDVPLSRPQVHDAVQQAAILLNSSHSYSNLLPDTRPEREVYPDTVSRADVEAALFRLIAPTGDGHAGVRTVGFPETGPFLPFLPIPVGETKLAVVKPDRTGLVDPEHPYLAAIDGIEAAKWMKAASRAVAVGSPQLIRDRSSRRLRSIADLAPIVGAKPKLAGESVSVLLADENGATRAIDMKLEARKPEYAMWPRTESRLIERDAARIGYLRVPEMDDGETFENEILARLKEFAGCRGLIIDVRGNPGGKRDIINIIGPRLLAPDAAPVVYNAARPLKLPDENAAKMDGRLSTRFLFRADDQRWSEAERAAIAAFRERFQPEVAFREERFGPWYFAVVSPAPADAPRITAPVVVLMDARCFSATDVFLAAMRLMPNVTLMGEASSGGSGLSRPHEIRVAANTPAEREWRFELSLSSMVSFTPEGRLFDRRGVEPHVVVPSTPAYFTIGGADPQLQAAFDHLATRPIR